MERLKQAGLCVTGASYSIHHGPRGSLAIHQTRQLRPRAIQSKVTRIGTPGAGILTARLDPES